MELHSQDRKVYEMANKIRTLQINIHRNLTAHDLLAEVAAGIKADQGVSKLGPYFMRLKDEGFSPLVQYL